MERNNHQSNSFNMLRIIKVCNRKWLKVPIAGMIFGILAQLLRQILGPLMFLGASTAPWIFIGFLLAFSASREAHTPRKAFFVASGTIGTYLITWLVSYHLSFILREHVTFADGWRQIAPWLVATVPTSLIIGTIIVQTHNSGLFGDISLAVPLACSLPETLNSLKEGWVDGIVFVSTISFLSVLLIFMARNERQVHMFTLLTSVLTLGALGVTLFSVIWFLFLGRY